MKSFPLTRLHIPEPCHESWDAMTPVRGGSFCDYCQKTVVDFTLMSDAAILLYIKEKGFGCGKFREDQLKRSLLPAPTPKRRLLPHFAFTLAAFWGLGNTLLAQKHNTPIEHPPQSENNKPLKFLRVSGTLTDEQGNPIINAEVELVTRSQKLITSSMTDYDGNFTLRDIPFEHFNDTVAVIFTYRTFRQTVYNIPLRKNTMIVNNKMTVGPGMVIVAEKLYVEPVVVPRTIPDSVLVKYFEKMGGYSYPDQVSQYSQRYETKRIRPAEKSFWQRVQFWK